MGAIKKVFRKSVFEYSNSQAFEKEVILGTND